MMMIRSTRGSFLSSLAFCCLAGADSWSFLGDTAMHRGREGLPFMFPRTNPFSRSRIVRSVSAIKSETEEASGITWESPVIQTDVPIRNDSGKTIVLADRDDFVKPDRDLRDYRVILLPNNLQVLLVSDKLKDGDVGVEAAAVHVHAGHMDDTIKGLAHFHEHMLFLGTKKYPNEEEYESFLSQYGGFSNAYTDMEDTNYYFSVTTEAQSPDRTSDALAGALDRFAQFFIAPTFCPDAVDRELRAIDSEHSMSKTSDSWRNFQLLKLACNQTHPFSKFGCGNYETLTELGLEELLSELRKFWNTYYQTYNLRLAVAGHASLDALQKTVEETFGNLPTSVGNHRRARSLPGQIFPREHVSGIAAFGTEQLGLIRKVIPYAETRVIKVYFATPPLEDHVLKRSKPHRVLSHILGHEAPGSLHALLNEEGYISALSAGSAIDTSDFSLFSITLAVTPKGMEAKHKVLDLLFQWIALLKENEDKLSSYHDELRQIARTNFRFRENGDPTDFVSSAAELLFDETTDPAKLLLDGSDASDYDPVVTKAFLERLSPGNCMITITSSDFDGNTGEWQAEQWYGAKYQVEKIPQEQIKAWGSPRACDKRLHLPALNKYIPTDFALKCDSVAQLTKDAETKHDLDDSELEVPPKVVMERPDLRVWHKMDRYWRVPKAQVRVALLSSSIYATPRSMTLNRLFQRVLNDDLNSFVYDASIAGCSYRVSCTPSGYRISVRGYSEKVPFLLDTLTSRIKSLIEEMKSGDSVLQKRFEKAIEGLLRETKNYRLDTPSEVNNYNSRLLIEENVWYLDNYVDELEGELSKRHPLTMEDCAKSAEEALTGRVKCELLCMGNIDEDGAREVAEVIDRQFLACARPLTEVETPRFRSLKLPTREEASLIFGPEAAARKAPLIYQELAYSETEDNNAVELLIQVGCEMDLGYEGMALLDLLTHIAYNSAFNQLRTKEQLGYYVSAFARKTAGGTWALSVVVQSGTYLPDKLEERCEAWLEQFRQELEVMSPESIAQEASAVVAQLLESETKLSQEVSRVWGEILNVEWLTDRMRTPAFDRLKHLAEILTVEEDGDDDEDVETVEDGDNDEVIESRSMSADELKRRLLALLDERISASSPNRRALSVRLYSHKAKAEYEASLGQPGVLTTYADMRQLKQFLSSWPLVPYWKIGEKWSS